MTQVLAAGTYYPPDQAFTGKPNSLFGMGLGTSFESHADAFASLVGQGFETRPERAAGTFQQIALSRRVAGAKASAAIYAAYDRHGILVTLSLAFAGESCSNTEEASRSAHKIRDFVQSFMGRDAVHLDRIGAWSVGTRRTYMPEAAFAAAWNSTSNASAVVDGSVEFESAAGELVGPTMTLIVSSALDGVTALLTIQSAAPT